MHLFLHAYIHTYIHTLSYILFLTYTCNVHDNKTLIPTVKGMVVAEWLEKHFPDLVEARFTAHMEDSLDKIARGEQDKLSFLSDFYLGEPSKQQEGLLARVAHKLERQEIDHKESQTLEVPFLSDLGRWLSGWMDGWVGR